MLDKRGDLRETVGPEDIFDYIYALLHAPAYRTRYHEFLKREFAKVPLTSNPEVFAALVRKGADLLSLHLMESPLIDKPVVSFPVSGSNEVDAIRFSGKERRVWVNKSQYFDDVGEAAWSFQIGGYDVCHKWLSDRKATRLSYKEVAHFQRLVAALQGTIELMAEIDAGSLPVQEDDRLVGVITDRDIAVRAVAQGKSPDTPVRDVMSREVLYCFEDQEVKEIARNMGDVKVRRLPVVNRDKRLVGIISVGDLALNEEPALTASAVTNISKHGGRHSQSAR